MASDDQGLPATVTSIKIDVKVFTVCSINSFSTRNEGAPNGVTSKTPQHCYGKNCHNIHFCDY